MAADADRVRPDPRDHLAAGIDAAVLLLACVGPGSTRPAPAGPAIRIGADAAVRPSSPYRDSTDGGDRSREPVRKYSACSKYLEGRGKDLVRILQDSVHTMK